MSTTRLTRRIAAPPARVFDTVAHPENFADAVPEIISVEFRTETRRGVGTRFLETREMKGRRSSTELEVTEYVADEQVRLRADAGGSIWDTRFTVREDAGQTELEMVMEARPYRLVSRLMNRLVKPMIEAAIARDLDAVKRHCEGL